MLSNQAAKETLLTDFDLLPILLDLITSIENSKDQKEELTRKVNLFKTKMAHCKDVLNKIGCIDSDIEKQNELHQKILKELQVKKSTLELFKNIHATTVQIKKEPP